jgi:ribonuclease III
LIFRRAYNLYFSKERKFTQSLCLLLGFCPRNISLYHQAFKHSSTTQQGEVSNERLELLGDSVLNMIIAEYLFRKFPNRREGFITEMRSKIVSRQQMNEIAYDMALHHFIKKSTSIRNLKDNDLLGNALEALIGAVFLDFGFIKARHFILRKFVAPHIDLAALERTEVNFKSKFINWAQINRHTPEFKLVGERKVGHRTLFVVGAFINDEQKGSGENFNKKQAEQQAAEEACKVLVI